MSKYSDTSDVRALARAILAQEELEQPSMRGTVPPYELDPVRRRVAAASRTGFVVGLTFGVFYAIEGVAARVWLFGGLAFAAACTVGATALGALVGAFAGLVVRWTQRRALDAEAEALTRDSS
jgi:hypothetical protein